MKITNNNNLPSAIVNACLEDDGHEPVEGVYHVTELIKPTKSAALLRRHYDEISQDASECIWLVFGKAVHSLLEKHDTTGYSEYKLEVKLENGLTITGRCDLFNEEEHAIEDYKTATVWKVLKCDFEDWRLQGLQYAYMMSKMGIYVAKIRFHAFLKDWSAGEMKRSGIAGKPYPQHPIYTWEHEVSCDELEEIHSFMLDRSSAEDEAIKALSDDDIPNCSAEERWNSGNKFAVMKKGRKTALKLFDTEAEARQMASITPDSYVEKRVGEDKRCNDYCLGCGFCSHYKKGE